MSFDDKKYYLTIGAIVGSALAGISMTWGYPCKIVWVGPTTNAAVLSVLQQPPTAKPAKQ